MRLRPRVVLLVSVLAATPAQAKVRLELPVRVAGSAAPAPAYQGDLIELGLTRPAARAAAAQAAARRSAGLARVPSLGIAPVDRLAAAMGGVWFEPEFPAETPPPPLSDEPDFTTFYLAHLPPGVELADALDRFRALGDVVSADPIACLPVEAFPNDSLFAYSPWYYQPGSRKDIHAPEAWNVTVGDTSVVVAILDTGVLSYHPDLGGRVAGLPGQIWTNWAEAAGVPGVDDDGNGYIDDFHGWDFVNGVPSDTLPGEDGSVEDNDPSDFAGHGTACAGLVGALTNNTIGVSGTAWNVRLMPLRMAWASAFSPSGEVRMDFAARAIRYATRNGAHVINCSWASDNTNGIDAALTAAVRAGITVVAAAGNNNPFHYVADREDCLGVAAVDSTDQVASFSNLGSFVDLAAPGVGIRTTWSAARVPTYNSGLNGTSFSAPLVSGVAALLRSVPQGSHPITPRGIQLRLMESADDISAENPGLAGQYGSGRLNAFRALSETSGSRVVRTGSRSIGAAVLLATNGNPHVAFLTGNNRLVELDAVTGDTVMVQPTIGVPNGDLAAADIGGGLGVGFFYATRADGVSAMLAGRGPAPGDWPQLGSGSLPMHTPALGDLDGDGSLEVVSGGDDGQLWAWHVDGSAVTGFPISTGFYPLESAPLVTDLDGAPGVEVVVAAQDGTIYAYRGDGAPLAGWPVTVGPNPIAPVAGRLGPNASPVIVTASGNQLYAFSPSGVPRPGFPVTLIGNVTQELALADLNGDGFDEIVAPTVVPSAIEVRDTLGNAVSALGWPRRLPGPPQSPPVLGELSTLSPGPELLIMRGQTLLALTHDADSLSSFPKPGRAGFSPSLGQADLDSRTEVAAGTGIDSLFYLYDAGPASDASGGMPWPTPRGNFARTGSRFYAPPLGTLDVVPPVALVDLRPDAIANTSVQLRWTAPFDPGPLGRATMYEARRSTSPITQSNFSAAILIPGAPPPSPAGEPESLLVTGLAEATTYYFGVRSIDQVGNRSLVVTVSATTTGGPPGPVTDLRAAAATDSSVSLVWTATGEDGSVGRASLYVIRGDTAPIDSASFATAPLQWTMSATVDAGQSEHLVFPGLSAATRYWFALVALDANHNVSRLSNVPMVQTGAGGPLNGRAGIQLAVLQNPSRASAELYWQAADNGVGAAQSIHLYDLAGRRVRVIDVGTGLGGRVTWDGRDAEGRSVPAGLYYARLLSGSFHTQTRLVLLP